MANLSIIFQIQKKILLTSLNFVPLATTAIFFFWRKNRSARGLLNDRKTHGPSAQAILESVQFFAYFSPPRLKSTRPAAVQKVSILRLAIFKRRITEKKNIGRYEKSNTVLTLNECYQSIDATWHSSVMIEVVLCVNLPDQRKVAQNLSLTCSTCEIIIFFSFLFCRAAKTG